MSHKKEEVHVMVDLETLGVEPGCSIISLGAVTFNERPFSSFYENISRSHNKELGFVEDLDTLLWWDKQADSARTEAFSGTAPIESVLRRFAGYLGVLRETRTPILWGNAATFDLKILEFAYKHCGIAVPWEFRSERCFRTLKGVFPQIVAPLFDGLKHTALADAKHQAAHAEAIFDYIYKEYPHAL